jgi:hypothetical protein
MTEQTPQTTTPSTPIKTEAEWRGFMRKHWAAFTTFAVAAVLLVAGAVYVWFVGNAQSTSLVPSTLNLWTMNNLVMFILHAIFWELVLIGIPAAVGGIAGWAWWKRIPEQEKQEYNLSQKKSKSNRAGGAISPLLFIAFAIKVYVDGNWNTAMAGWTVDYVVGSMITILIWTVAIFAIPAIIGLVWWLCHGTNKKP